MPRTTVGCEGKYNIQIGWKAEGHVQLGVETLEGHALIDFMYGGIPTLGKIGEAISRAHALELPKGLKKDEIQVEYTRRGRAVLDTVRAAGFDGDGHYTGTWASLDRNGCNQLIQNLRRARDVAFGKDQ